MADGLAEQPYLQRRMPKFEFFRSSQISTDCDQCGGRVDLLKGGVCSLCRKILCYRDLHGSWLRRLLTDLGTPVVCVQCRTRPASTPHDRLIDG